MKYACSWDGNKWGLKTGRDGVNQIQQAMKDSTGGLL